MTNQERIEYYACDTMFGTFELCVGRANRQDGDELSEIAVFATMKGCERVAKMLNDLLDQLDQRDAALKECYSCIEDGKPGDALDVIDRVLDGKEQDNG